MELPVKASISGGRKISYRLETKNLSYRLCGNTSKFSNLCGLLSEKEEKIILKDVSCDAEITAIAGPSGAGKTTLLEILAGKVSHGKVLGQVLVNGLPMDRPEYRRISGFVPQENALFPFLTVQETLTYSALLRLKTKRKDAALKVKRLIQEIGLEHVADSRIGEGSRSGISGGERRRVSIGVELIHDPNVILIDEPTSGLDSASALQVVMLLKDMTLKQGKTIVLTIHQPGFRILEQINRIVLLSNILVVQNGSVHSLLQKVKFSSHQILKRVNVLEYAIDIAASLEPIRTQSCREISCYGHSKTWKSCYNNAGGEFHQSDSHSNSVLEEVQILGQRSCKNIFRTKQLFTTRALQASIAGLILGSIYLNVGNRKEEARSLYTYFPSIFHNRRTSNFLTRQENLNERDIKESLQSFVLRFSRYNHLHSFLIDHKHALYNTSLLASWSQKLTRWFPLLLIGDLDCSSDVKLICGIFQCSFSKLHNGNISNLRSHGIFLPLFRLFHCQGEDSGLLGVYALSQSLQVSIRMLTDQ